MSCCACARQWPLWTLLWALRAPWLGQGLPWTACWPALRSLTCRHAIQLHRAAMVTLSLWWLIYAMGGNMPLKAATGLALCCSACCSHLAELKTLYVQEAIGLLIAFRQFRMAGGEAGLRCILPLIFAREQGAALP